MRPFQRFRRIVGGGGEEIDVAEVVFRGEEGIHPVEEGLQLAGDAVVVNGGGEYDDVGGLHFFGDGPGVVGDDAAARFLAGEAARAEGDALAFQGDLLHGVARFTRPGRKGSGEAFGIAALTEAGRENEYVFHGFLLGIQERAGAL